MLSIVQVGTWCPENVLSCSYFSRNCGKSYNNKRSSGTQICVLDSSILQPSFKDWMKGEELELGHQDWAQFHAVTGVTRAHDNYVDVTRDKMNDTGWGALPQLWPLVVYPDIIWINLLVYLNLFCHLQVRAFGFRYLRVSSIVRAFGFRHPRVSSRVLQYLGWEIIILTKWEITVLLRATPSPIAPCKIKSTRLRVMLKILGIYRRCLWLVSNSLWLCLLCHLE